MNEFKYGDRVVWSYFTGRFGRLVRKEKVGLFTGYVRHTVKHWRKPGSVQMAHVAFDGNYGTSTVPVRDLRLVKNDR